MTKNIDRPQPSSSVGEVYKASQEILSMQGGIRELIDGSLGTTPKTIDTAEDADLWGLNPDTIEDNVVNIVGGGFPTGLIRITPKEDPQTPTYVIRWIHVGGDMSAPNRYVESRTLLPNGDIVGTTFVEPHDSQPETYDRAYKATNADEYIGALRFLLEKTKDIVDFNKPKAPEQKRRLGGKGSLSNLISKILGR